MLLGLLVVMSAVNPSFAAKASEPVASDKSEDAYLYVTGKNQISLKYKGITEKFAWETGMSGYYSPEMRVFDYDKDGEKEIAVSICVGTGSGVSVYDLHIVKPQNGKLVAYTYDQEVFL
jgi:hypothetical protein